MQTFVLSFCLCLNESQAGLVQTDNTLSRSFPFNKMLIGIISEERIFGACLTPPCFFANSWDECYNKILWSVTFPLFVKIKNLGFTKPTDSQIYSLLFYFFVSDNNTLSKSSLGIISEERIFGACLAPLCFFINSWDEYYNKILWSLTFPVF